MASAFFYGTLMHPKILKRVIGHDGYHLQISPALLLDYTRHKVKGEDYPGIVPYAQGRTMFDEDLDLQDRSVRGSLVTGLSAQDMRLLDTFEGNEYTREVVLVHPLGRAVALDDLEASGIVPKDIPPIPARNELMNPVQVNTYVWRHPLSRLRPGLWTFEEFARESAWKWVGPGSRDNQYYTEIDRRQAMDGVIIPATASSETYY
ncbi:hypothetical protein JVU11DRAFT_4317 [Chiua virens]|nr:hypothetical protein JVU11DRAFT_4317 [Chiua virens]